MSKRARWLSLGALLLAVGGVFGIVRAREKQKPPAAFTTVPVTQGQVVARVTATGTLSALVTVQVGAQVSGRISELFADFNSKVEKGKVLAKLDPQLLNAALEQTKANEMAARGNLAKAQAQALDAERQYARSKQLADKKLIAPADLDTAQATSDAAKATVLAAQGAIAQAKASRHQAEINLAYTVIKSPIDGVVISRSIDVGQTVAASLAAPTLFTIAQDLSKMQVDTNVAEADVGKLRAGLPATFNVDAYPGRTFHGVIRQIRNAPLALQSVVTYDAVIDVDNPDQALKPGMTANVTFAYAQADDVLTVPNAALRFRPAADVLAGAGKKGGAHPRHTEGATPKVKREDDPSARTLWVLEGERPRPVRVTVGLTDGTMTQVTGKGLAAGDAVITQAAGSGAPPAGGASRGRAGRLF